MDLAILVGVAATLLVVLYLAARSSGPPREDAGARGPVEDPVEERTRRDAESAAETFRTEIDRRLDEIGARVEEVAGIVRGLLDREPAAPVAETVEPVVREAIESLDARLAELASVVAERRVETVHQAVERELGRKGYTDVRVIEEPKTEGTRTRVLVNARRDGMTYKGSIHLEGARVVELRLAPSYPMFP